MSVPRYLNVLLSAAIVFFVLSTPAFAQSGSIVAVTPKVNGSPGADFQPGDLISVLVSATGSVPTEEFVPYIFSIVLEMYDNEENPVAYASALIEVDPGETKNFACSVAYTVPTSEYSQGYRVDISLRIDNVPEEEDWVYFSTD